MRYVGLGLVWDELAVGDTFRTVGRTITETDIVSFVNTTGMTEVLFTDMEYLAAHAPMKGRVAPAALVYGFAEGLLIQATMQYTGLAFLNMTLDVKGPSFAGDTVHVECEVVEITPKRNDRALVRTFNRIVNQKGETVITYNPLRMMAGRAALPETLERRR
jgi:acyl dehydratase